MQTRQEWEQLVRASGLAEATRRIMAENPGQGDSLHEVRSIWEGMGLADIYDALLEGRVPYHVDPAPLRTQC
jgi:hypothetical protein